MGWLKKCRYCEKSMRATLIRNHVMEEHPQEYDRIMRLLAEEDARNLQEVGQSRTPAGRVIARLQRYALPPRGPFRVLMAVCLFTIPGLAWGQATTITVDIAKAALTWQWSQGTGGPVEKWFIRCGPSSTNYNIMVTLPTPTARSIPISQVTPEVGTYLCIVSANNAFGTSAPSQEVSYSAGKVPLAATSLAIQAQ